MVGRKSPSRQVLECHCMLSRLEAPASILQQGRARRFLNLLSRNMDNLQNEAIMHYQKLSNVTLRRGKVKEAQHLPVNIVNLRLSQGWFCGGWHTGTLGWFFHLGHTGQEIAACEAACSIFYTQTGTCTKQALTIETTHAHRSCLRACSTKPLMCPRCPSPLFRNDNAMPGPLICISHCLCLIHR